MAYCEKCGTGGLDMRSMSTDQDKKVFVGPCCVTSNTEKVFETEGVQYGLEISSHMGIHAYAQFGGLAVEFRRTKEDIQKWMDKQAQEAGQELPPDERTSEGPTTTPMAN